MSLFGFDGLLALPGLALLVMGLLFVLRGRDARAPRSTTGVASADHRGGFAPSAVQDEYTPSFIQDTPTTLGTGVAALMIVQPPSGARPAMLGVLVHESARASDMAATIVDLALRGYLSVERFTAETGVPRGLLYGLPEGSPIPALCGPQDPSKAGVVRALATKLGMDSGWALTMTAPPADAEPLLAYERVLLHGIFANVIRRPEGARPGLRFIRAGDLEVPTPSNTYPVVLSSLRTTYSSMRRPALSKLYAEVVSRRWFRTSPKTVHRIWYGIAWAFFLGGVGTFVGWSMPTVTALTAAVSTFATSSGASLGVGMMLAAVVVGAFGGVMSSRTAPGTAIYTQARSFRQYLQAGQPAQVGLEQQFELFSTSLPFAMALGVEKQWTGAFNELIDASEAAERAHPTAPGHSGISSYSGLSTFAKEVHWIVRSSQNSPSSD